jgi:hypothetical protein
MSHHIKEIVLDERFKNYKIAGGHVPDSRLLQRLSKVNLFVGANNCGKSRFLRSLASSEKLEFVPELGEKDFRKLQPLRDGFVKEVGAIVQKNGYNEPALRDLDTTTPMFGSMKEGPSASSTPRQLLNNIEAVAATVTPDPRRINPVSQFRLINEDILRAAKHYVGEVAEIVSSVQDTYEFSKIYIPVLRGLRDFPGLKDGQNIRDIYQERSMTDYFPKFKPEVWTGLTLYLNIQQGLLGNLEQRDTIAEYQRFLGENFFEGQKVALIPKLNNTVLDIKIGDEDERPIYDVGDGIQSIMTITFPLFRDRGKKVLLFCEEPELYMHPGLQRALLNLLTGHEEFSEFQYFFTTHSNHLLDLTLDISRSSIYTFHKEIVAGGKKVKDTVFTVENVSNDNTRSLRLLGVQNSSVFLSNCTIWVEGVTDRDYFRKYLELYQASIGGKPFKEDLHYSFVEYSGSNITHWSFLHEKGPVVDRLCGTLFLIADSDNAGSEDADDDKAQRFKTLRDKLDDRFCVLKCKEVENLLSPSILIAVLKAYGETELNESFTEPAYATEHLGKFIENVIIKKDAKKRIGSYIDGNTISDKLKFCSRATAAMTVFTDLSLEAQQITKRVYDFIESKNKADR